MKIFQKLFGGINLTWTKLIIFAILAGAYTAAMAIIPAAKYTSFQDITVTFEVWILFGIFIIMNSKSAKDSALKCFVFFLISQPLVYLIQVPFNVYGWGIFVYYRYWFIWTLLTIPMGFIGYYMKKDQWWGVLILIPILGLLGLHYSQYLGETIMSFPNHVLTTAFCAITMLLYPFLIFKNKKARVIGAIIGIAILSVTTVIALSNKTEYKTTILVSEGSEGIVFDDNYKVYLKDENFGKVYIVYEEALEDYMVNADFVKTGVTEFTIESPSGEKVTFEIDIKKDTYKLTRK